MASVAAFTAGALVFGKQVDPPVSLGADGKLTYVVESTGDRIVDFSHAGYAGGGVPLPDVAARVRVEPVEGDDGRRLQTAIDYVSELPLDADGVRGAVELGRGRFEIAGQLVIRASGVVLRGAGNDDDGTVLVATGTSRRALITLGGSDPRETAGAPTAIAADYVPVNASRLRLAARNEGIRVGTRVRIERPSPAEWIAFLGMDVAPGRQPYTWKPGAFNVSWDRVVTGVEGDVILIDAPLTVALDRRFGGATVTPYVKSGYVERAGIENLRCESEFERGNPHDEQHAWNAIEINAARDVWVADVVAAHFAGSAVQLGSAVTRATVQDCRAVEPISELAGYRRLAFHTRGQQTLFLRCRSEKGRNDFTAGYLVAGPTVLAECVASETNGFSGSIGSWASGILFDNVTIDGGALRIDNLETWNQGVGWAAANSVIWNSSASVIACRTPPGAVNWAVAVWGQFVGDGRWSQVNEFARPVSLWRAQLVERLGVGALRAIDPRKYTSDARVPSLDVVVSDLARRMEAKRTVPGRSLALANGWLTANGALLRGSIATGAWWLGRLEPARAAEAGVALTRFAPGLSGTGFTDEIPAVAEGMVAKQQVAFRHHYGLWYDRRRIDHQMIRRPDAEVYPPFFEQPFARSGRGRAWDGLSRYDLTQYNPWYFERLRTFAEEARARGLVLISEMFFQHNILESGAHWVDSPWRPVNNINDTGFTEPPPFRGDTIRMADEFYDVTHPGRRGLHRAYIRQCLAALAAQPNVIHSLSEEFTGPRHFVEFWLDTIAEWKSETGQAPLISLSATKDVTDSILGDARRGAPVSVIELKYWWRTENGLFAPKGGENLAPRQHERLWKGGRPTAHSIAGIVRDYRSRFPDKAVISPLLETEGWSFVAAGGSFPKLPATTAPSLLEAIGRMRPVAERSAADAGQWTLAEAGRQYFGYTAANDVLRFDIGLEEAAWRVQWVDLETGKIARTERRSVKGSITIAGSGPFAVWLARE